MSKEAIPVGGGRGGGGAGAAGRRGLALGEARPFYSSAGGQAGQGIRCRLGTGVAGMRPEERVREVVAEGGERLLHLHRENRHFG